MIYSSDLPPHAPVHPAHDRWGDEALFNEPGWHDDGAEDGMHRDAARDQVAPAGAEAPAVAAEVDPDSAAELAFAEQPARLPPAASETQLASWIAAIGQHDEQALAALYDATAPRVYGLVLRIVRKAALAEEVVEDTFFQVWRQALRFDATRGAPMAWLLGMARSRAIDGLRRDARFQHQSLDSGCLAEVADNTPATDDLLDVARGHADLHRALMLLNAQPRQLVALAFFRGLSHEEIACQTQLPLGTVKSQIRRALMMLRQALGDAAMPTWAT